MFRLFLVEVAVERRGVPHEWAALRRDGEGVAVGARQAVVVENMRSHGVGADGIAARPKRERKFGDGRRCGAVA
ncbi:hypothetical protein [Rhizobium sp. LjRoot258]|uniref:hypothetical protein n=1 Tax=Rhizobium sp. LjRoot258 TaxID=3342299 RepID=UPI003ECFDC43